MRKLILILFAGLAASSAFAHNGLKVTSQQAVAVYAGSQGVMRYAGGGNISNEADWGRPVSHSVDDGDTVYLVARANGVAMRGILAEVKVPGEQVLSGDARWEMFTIKPDRLIAGAAPDESTLFDWVNRANDSAVWKFPDLSGLNNSSSPEFIDGIEDTAARMSRRLAAGNVADVGNGAPDFVVCRLRLPKFGTGDVAEPEQKKQIDDGSAGGDDPGATAQNPQVPQVSGSGSGGGGGGGGGGKPRTPGLIDPDPEDPTTEVPLTDPPPPVPPGELPKDPTPVIPPPVPPTLPPRDPPLVPPSNPPTTPQPPIPNPPPFTPPIPTPPPAPPEPPTIPSVPAPGTLLVAGLGATLAATRRRRGRA